MAVVRLALVLICLALAGCPPISVSPTEIKSARVVGAGSDLIHVVGRGFAPSGVDYNLASGTGRAWSSDLILEVVRSTDGRMTPSARVDLLSTTELDAHLSIPLLPGVYDVRLRRESSSEALAELEGAFMIEVSQVEDPPDGGVVVEEMDGGVLSDPDAELDGGVLVGEDVAVYPDASPPEDLGPPDLGIPPDSGLGPFAGNYLYRQEVRLTNMSADVAPIGATFVVPIFHQTMIAAGSAKADGTDFALYLGATPVPYAWDDSGKLGTDQLVMVAQLSEVIAAGAERDRTVPLILYYGDPTANVQPDDGVFTFVQRFTGILPNGWTTRLWTSCAWDRSSELPAASNGAYCVRDGIGEQRVSLSSPRVGAIDQTIAPNLVYVLAFHLSGVMSTANDLVYFSVDDNVAEYDETMQLDATAWVESAPLVSQTFEEINNFGDRTVFGWRFGTTRQPWTRSVARFRPPVDEPSLHVRFLSIDNALNGATEVALDDYTARLALDVELTGTLEMVEVR